MFRMAGGPALMQVSDRRSSLMSGPGFLSALGNRKICLHSIEIKA
jgi:hypothetical protein